MARRSTIEMDDKIRAAVDDALKRGVIIDDITVMLQGMGANISRSAVGRWAQKYGKMAERERDILAVARNYADEFGGSDNPVGKLLIQTVTSIAARTVMAHSEDEDGSLDPKDLHFIARAVKDIMGAAKIDADRDALVRKEEREKAADRAVKSLRSQGASEETIAMIRREILGMED